MIGNILDNLEEYIATDNLGPKDKQARKHLAYKLSAKVKESLFQLFYDDFFAYSIWNVGYPKDAVSLLIRNPSYSTFIKIIFNFKNNQVSFESILYDYKKVYGLYYFPIKSTLVKKYDLINEESKSLKIKNLEFNDINMDKVYEAVSEISKDIEKNELNQSERYKNINDSEIFFFNEKYELDIDLDEFENLLDEFRIEKDFLKSENKKIIDEINRTDNSEQILFLTNLIAHLNLKLIYKYMHICKEEKMKTDEIKFIVGQLYKGLIDAANKIDLRLGSFSTYAFSRILSKFQRGRLYVVRDRVFKELGHKPAIHTLQEHQLSFKRNFDRYLTIDEVTEFGKMLSAEKIMIEKEKQHKKEKENTRVSLQYLLLSEFNLESYDLKSIKDKYEYIKNMTPIVINDSIAYEVISKRYRFDDKYKIRKPVTLEEIGKNYSITRERVRQIEKESLEIMNRAINLFPVGTQIDVDYLAPLIKKGEGRGRKTTSNFTDYDWLIKFFKLNKIFFLGEFKELDINDSKFKLPKKTSKLNLSQAIIEQEKLHDDYVEDKNLIINYNLSIRSKNVLEKEGLELVSDIDVEKLPYITNLGYKSITEIQKMVMDYRSSL